MGIFSFGKKRAEAPSRRGGAAPGARAAERDARNDDSEANAARAARLAAARGRPARKGGQEAMLDPTLPEKQRARRRLVGAVALVLAAVVILPMVLDSRPKPVTDGIAISIPAQDTPVAHGSARHGNANHDTDADAANPGEAAAPDAAPDAAPGTTDLRGNAAGASPSGTAANAPGGGAAGPDVKAPPTQRAATKPPAPVPAKPARPTPTPTDTPPPAPAATLPSTPATPGSRYVVQLGSFENEAAARDWVGKLKHIGVPAYIEHTKQADGTLRAMLRAGPFADRTVAQAAVLKVRQAGLSQAGR